MDRSIKNLVSALCKPGISKERRIEPVQGVFWYPCFLNNSSHIQCGWLSGEAKAGLDRGYYYCRLSRCSCVHVVRQLTSWQCQELSVTAGRWNERGIMHRIRALASRTFSTLGSTFLGTFWNYNKILLLRNIKTSSIMLHQQVHTKKEPRKTVQPFPNKSGDGCRSC